MLFHFRPELLATIAKTLVSSNEAIGAVISTE